jgi:hypothetical protein
MCLLDAGRMMKGWIHTDFAEANSFFHSKFELLSMEKGQHVNQDAEGFV